jgi:hypothetical protein
VHKYLKKTAGRFSLSEVKRQYAAVRRVYDKGSREIREALNELSTISEDEMAAKYDSMSAQESLQTKERGETIS